MKITRLTNQKMNTERVNLFIDGKYELSLTKDQLLDQKIFINKEINEAELKKLKDLSSEGLVRARTIEWLFIRPRSARELKMYLKNKKVDSYLSEKLVMEMQHKKYQNDTSFCSWWIDQRLSKKMSLAKIRSELFSKGINKEIIEQSISEKNIDDYENMVLFIESKRLTHKYQDQIKLKKYLFSKGYKYETIARFFNQQN